MSNFGSLSVRGERGPPWSAQALLPLRKEMRGLRPTSTKPRQPAVLTGPKVSWKIYSPTGE